MSLTEPLDVFVIYNRMKIRQDFNKFTKHFSGQQNTKNAYQTNFDRLYFIAQAWRFFECGILFLSRLLLLRKYLWHVKSYCQLRRTHTRSGPETHLTRLSRNE